MQNMLRNLPKIDEIINNEQILFFKDYIPPVRITASARKSVDILRNSLLEKKDDSLNLERHELLEKAIFTCKKILSEDLNDSFRRIINATGIIIHTNLGRSPLPQKSLDKINNILCGYNNLEYGVKEGARKNRLTFLEKIITDLTGAESALIVNNNAAAVFLALNTLSKDKEVILSRGEFVEIGDSFRISEIVETSGCIVKPVGTTNCTVLSDYEKAINPETSLLLKMHTSNFKIFGFTKTVEADELTALATKNNIPVMEDMGSGVMIDLSHFGFKHERTVFEAVKDGIDIITFSGDKMLGGPQAGIIIGKKKYIDAMKKNQLLRCLRLDKLSLAALEATLSLYFGDKLIRNIPVIDMMLITENELKEKADKLLTLLQNKNSSYNFEIVHHEAQFGGGSIPTENIDSLAVSVTHKNKHPNQISDMLREHTIPIISVVENDKTLLDVRTLFERDFEEIAKAF